MLKMPHVLYENCDPPPKWLGVVATHCLVTLVEAWIPSRFDAPIVVQNKLEWTLSGCNSRQQDLSELYEKFGAYVQEACIDYIVVKASALYGERGARLNMLHGAEVRGVILAAAAKWCPVRPSLMATISKTFGHKKVREYLKDDAFWQSQTIGGERLRSTGREATLLMLAARKSNSLVCNDVI